MTELIASTEVRLPRWSYIVGAGGAVTRVAATTAETYAASYTVPTASVTNLSEKFLDEELQEASVNDGLSRDHSGSTFALVGV